MNTTTGKSVARRSEIGEVAMKTTTAQIDWRATLTEALNAPGSLGTTYTRFYNYSFLNQIRLMMQGAREPVATYNRWQELGRQVRKGMAFASMAQREETITL
jgi:hypothetical protein